MVIMAAPDDRARMPEIDVFRDQLATGVAHPPPPNTSRDSPGRSVPYYIAER
jgi:hypothetical protein